MKGNTKSSVTLPPETFALVRRLKRRLGAKSNVEIVRQGLRLLHEQTERAALRDAYARASTAVRVSTEEELSALDELSGEGLDHDGD